MAQQFVYTMKGLGKVVPPKREILKNIWLSFLPGAKIGVLGNNGAGKSSLMRIMAGIDTEFTGEAFAAEGLKVGFLSQEPALDASKDVFGNVEDGVRVKRDMLQRFEDLSMKMGESMSDVGGIAWPIRLSGGSYAISIAGPVYRIEQNLQSYAERLRVACRFIEEA